MPKSGVVRGEDENEIIKKKEAPFTLLAVIFIDTYCSGLLGLRSAGY